jgi:tRNA threonylcarbamoyladenosine biosynthesis protein TsaE
MGRDRIIPLSSAEDTVLAGRIIGSALTPHTVLALSGDLGAGKTTFVQGLALGLGHDALIQSPTFIYLNVYEGTILPLFHFDLYRMKTASDFLGLGFDEYFDKGGVCAIEWPEKIASLLPKSTLYLSFAHHPRGGRTLNLSGAFPEKLIESLSLCH